MTQQPQTTTIADLLYKAKIISQDQLARAVATSIRTNATIGKALVANGAAPDIVRTGALAHTLLVENLIVQDMAVEAVSKAISERINLEEALEQLGWRTDYRIVVGRLCQLLIESGSVSEADINNAVEASAASGLPLGRVLVVRRVVPETLVYAALTGQVLIKEGKITSDQAIAGLKLATKDRIDIEVALTRLGAIPATRTDPIRLGELLSAAGLVSEIDLLSAVEKGMGQEMPIGQVLFKHGLLPQHILDKALTLQFMVNNRSLTPNDAIAQLQRISKTPREELVDPRTEDKGQFGEISGTFSTAGTYFSGSGRSDNIFEDYGSAPDPSKVLGLYKREDWMRTIQELTLEKQNLAYKVVSQQEEMKYRLARELHDTIIADLMMLKRYLGGDRKLSNDETIEIVDHIVMQLRDICSDFAPRNFKEWGLKMTLQDTLERMSQRTGIQSTFLCEFEISELPDPVGLHIYRIIQEGLNNVEKYSGASEVSLLVERPKEKSLRFRLADNGKGFSTQETGSTRRTDNSGGMGMGGMKERADLIRCFFPTSLSVDSSPGHGSTVTLEIELT
jgi:signal transduction histidine kinase